MSVSPHEQAVVVPSVSELFADIRSLAQIEATRRSSEGRVYPTPDGKLHVSALERKFAGCRVEITELPIAKEMGQRAIERWSRGNDLQVFGAPPPGVRFSNVRYHPQTHARYNVQDMFRYARRSKGVIEAIDPDEASLIINPHHFVRSAWFGGEDRHWVKLLSDQNEPLVQVDFL